MNFAELQVISSSSLQLNFNTMEQKFVITADGYFRYGVVRLHKDLLVCGDICLGGGYYEFDYASGRMLLDRESYDFGMPRWHRLNGTLKVPSELRGLRLVYTSPDRYVETLDINEEFEIDYI